MAKSTIGALETGATHPVYRREDGGLWMKINERFHCPAQLDELDDYYVGGGTVEALDPTEEVEVVHEANEEKA